MADLQGRQQTVSGFIQGNYQNIATDFIKVESTKCHILKVGRIFSFIKSYKFTVKK